MTIAQRIRQARRDASLSQEELASLTGRNQTTVSRWERDELVPSARDAVRIAAVCGVSVAWLLGDAEPSATGTEG